MEVIFLKPVETHMLVAAMEAQSFRHLKAHSICYLNNFLSIISSCQFVSVSWLNLSVSVSVFGNPEKIWRQLLLQSVDLLHISDAVCKRSNSI